MQDFFTKFSSKTAHLVGTHWSFLLALLVVVIWGLTGPLFHYSDTWQLVINTGTTIVTFLMVFLIQNTQNRDAKAMHMKLNELISAVNSAHNEMIDIENLSDEKLENIAAFYRQKKARSATRSSSALADNTAGAEARMRPNAVESDASRH